MAEAQKQSNNEKQAGENQKDSIHGRIYNTNNPAFENLPSKNDISQVDQQEGNMNHGEEGPELNRKAGEGE
jgi:hypothetical protein